MYRLLSLLILFSVALARAADTDQPVLRPLAVLPRLARPPAIDGIITSAEWPTLQVHRFVARRAGGRDLLQPRDGEFYVASDGKRLYVAVRSALHPRAGAIATSRPDGNRDIPGVSRDDTIELWIDADPAGPAGRLHHLIINPLTAWFDQVTNRTTGVTDPWWRSSSLRQAHNVANGFWSAELSIELAEVGIADPTRPFGLHICRNYRHPWDLSGWAPRVNAFDEPGTMPLVSLADHAPAVQEKAFQDEQGIAVAVDIVNPSQSPLPLKVRLGGNAEGQLREYQEWEVNLAPQQRRSFLYRRPVAAGSAMLAEILVSSPDGSLIFHHRDVKWQTPSTTTWELNVANPLVDATEFDIEWHPTQKILRWRVALPPTLNQISRFRLQISDAGTGNVLHTLMQQSGAVPANDHQTHLADLPDGRYVAALFLDAPTPAAQPALRRVFEHASDFPWLRQQLGVSNQVIPPFTPLKVTGILWETRRVHAIGREHLIANNGLWSQVIANGGELLTDPMQLRLHRNGAESTANGQLRFLEKADHRVILTSAWIADDYSGTLTSEFDYDGCMKVTIDLPPSGGVTIDALDLVLPLRDDMAQLMYSCIDKPRDSISDRVPAGDGIVWSSGTGRDDRAVPYLWLGNEARGICWFAADDRDWVLDETGATPALQLQRSQGSLQLRVRFIQQPTILRRHRRIVFGLQATPVKPMPDSPPWKQVGFYRGAPVNLVFYDLISAWGGRPYSVYPSRRDFTIIEKLADARRGTPDLPWFSDYIAQHPQSKAEINWALRQTGDHGIAYTNLRGAVTASREWRVYQDEWRNGNFLPRETRDDIRDGHVDETVLPVPSRIDFLLYNYREMLRRGMDGIYWDHASLYPNMNHVQSNGYFRPDGSYRTSTDLWQLRELAKRTAVLAHQIGKPNLNMINTTDACLVPVAAWTGAIIGWHGQRGSRDFQDRFTREHIRAVNLGHQTGNLPCVRHGNTYEIQDPDRRRFVERTRAGVALVHELILHNPDPFYIQLHQYLARRAAIDTHRYWDSNPVLAIRGLDAAWIVHSSSQDVIVILVDYGKGGDGQIALDTARLGISPTATATDFEAIDKRYPMQDGVLTLPHFTPHDVHVLRLPK